MGQVRHLRKRSAPRQSLNRAGVPIQHNTAFFVSAGDLSRQAFVRKTVTCTWPPKYR